jgi:hypothetical protein
VKIIIDFFVQQNNTFYWLNLQQLDSESYTNISDSVVVEKCCEVGSTKRSWAGAKSSYLSHCKKFAQCIVVRSIGVKSLVREPRAIFFFHISPQQGCRNSHCTSHACNH